MNPANHSPEWQIEFEEYLKHLNLSERDFRNRLQLPTVGKIKRLIPLKDIQKVESILPITHEFLCQILRRVKTMDGQLPFKNSEFEMLKIDPLQLRIGQKYAYRENYIGLLEGLTGLFCQKHAINSGITNLGAFMIFGNDVYNQPALSFYLPPIVEQHNFGLVIMDGIHRDYMTLQMGATIFAIVVSSVSIPFPCSAQKWKELRMIGLAEKPPDANERYFDLKKNLFRDLKHLGIDG